MVAATARQTTARSRPAMAVAFQDALPVAAVPCESM